MGALVGAGGVLGRAGIRLARIQRTNLPVCRVSPPLSPPQLVQKHLGVSIEDPEFWRGSISIVARKLQNFEEHLQAAGLA